eukprot:3142070-Rhodomonas_salina.2
MAKFEEADPRWKVKELGQQGTNVNNWEDAAARGGGCGAWAGRGSQLLETRQDHGRGVCGEAKGEEGDSDL